jgi:hypothetical protein
MMVSHGLESEPNFYFQILFLISYRDWEESCSLQEEPTPYFLLEILGQRCLMTRKSVFFRKFREQFRELFHPPY